MRGSWKPGISGKADHGLSHSSAGAGGILTTTGGVAHCKPPVYRDLNWPNSPARPHVVWYLPLGGKYLLHKGLSLDVGFQSQLG